MNSDQDDGTGHRQIVLPVPPTDNKRKEGFFSSIFLLNAMLAPKLITLFYWIFLIAAIIAGIGMVGTGDSVKALQGIGLLTFGVVLIRILCEFWIVIFKIHENLKKIADKS